MLRASTSRTPARHNGSNGHASSSKGLVRGKPGAGRRRDEDSPEEDNNDDDNDDETSQARTEPKLEQAQEKYLNQVIDRESGGGKLKSIVTDLTILRGTLQKAYEALVATAVAVAEMDSDQDAEQDGSGKELPPDSPVIAALDEKARLIIIELECATIRSAAASELRQLITQGSEVRDIHKTHNDALGVRLKAYTDKTSRQKFLDSDSYAHFRSSIWEALYGSAVPNIKKMLPAEEGDDEESDDEVEIGAQTTDYKCPLTLTILIKPMTSKTCKHTFSGASIKEYLKNERKECPIPGCHQLVMIHDFEDNELLASRVEGYLRREKEEKRAKPGTQFQVLSSDEEEEDDD